MQVCIDKARENYAGPQIFAFTQGKALGCVVGCGHELANPPAVTYQYAIIELVCGNLAVCITGKTDQPCSQFQRLHP
jgi:hypothetical protein